MIFGGASQRAPRGLYLREYQPRPAQIAMIAMTAMSRPAMRLPRFILRVFWRG